MKNAEWRRAHGLVAHKDSRHRLTFRREDVLALGPAAASGSASSMTTPVASWGGSVITGLRWTGRGLRLGLAEVWWWIGGALRFLRPRTSSGGGLDGRHGLRLPAIRPGCS